MLKFKISLLNQLFFIVFLIIIGPIYANIDNLRLQINEGERLFEATLFKKAINLYEPLLPLLADYPQENDWIRFRLAQSYYFTEQYDQIPEILDSTNLNDNISDPKFQEIVNEKIFLLGITFNRLKKYDHAITSFKKYLSLENKAFLKFDKEAQFELGLSLFHSNQLVEAKKQFGKISEDLKNSQYYSLSRVYLGRIALNSENYDEAEAIIQQLEHQDYSDKMIPFAIAFLKGQLLFQRGHLEQAALSFEQAIPKQNQKQIEWHEDALYNLGTTYFHLAQNDKDNPDQQAYYYRQAEQVYQNVVDSFPTDKAFLALGQCYLAQGNELNNQESLKKLESLLKGHQSLFKQKSKHQVLLLRAEAAGTYSEKRKFLRQLIQPSNSKSPFYAKAWYLSGLNDLEQGQTLIKINQSREASRHFEHSIKALNRAFELLYPIDKKVAILSLAYQIHAHQSLKTKNGYQEALKIIDQILNQYRQDLFPLIENPDEIFYLQGVIASYLIGLEDRDTYFKIAKNSLDHNLESYPQGKFYGESLKHLGTLYYQAEDLENAKKTFLKVVKDCPSSPLAAEALFWTANCIDKLGYDQEKSKEYRNRIIEEFPNSPFADEAYFSSYSFAEYLKGERNAIEHLKGLENRFPKSPLQIISHYLLGLNSLNERKSVKGMTEKSLSSAMDSFQKVEETFQSLKEKDLLSDEKLTYFINVLYRARLDKSKALMDLADLSKGGKKRIYLENAIDTLQQIDSDHQAKNQESLAHFQEECAYYLAKCYFKADQPESAEQVLSQMLEKYQSLKITRGYYLSRVWHEHGILALKNKEYQVALQCFEHAEDAAKGKILSTDELLDSWLQQSSCYRGLQKMDDAMLILSKVINYDAVSSLRIKAMYNRAKIYEEQQRYELARKQLEATAKKGGEWARKAKIRLEENYVYQ